MSEFQFERGEILTNLVLLEDHADKFQCPFCMEKHLSKIIGYADEISLGGEDVKNMKKLAETARKWRREIQGAKSHTHNPIRLTPKQERCVIKVKAKIRKGQLPKKSNPYAICIAKVK